MSAYVQVWPGDDGWSFESGSLLIGDDVRITPPGQPLDAARWCRDLAAGLVAEAERLEEYHAQALRDLAAARAELAAMRVIPPAETEEGGE